eukprot:scaffold131032_cov40-Phaeocystis_antarctica.AAC.4
MVYLLRGRSRGRGRGKGRGRARARARVRARRRTARVASRAVGRRAGGEARGSPRRLIGIGSAAARGSRGDRRAPSASRGRRTPRATHLPGSAAYPPSRRVVHPRLRVAPVGRAVTAAVASCRRDAQARVRPAAMPSRRRIALEGSRRASALARPFYYRYPRRRSSGLAPLACRPLGARRGRVRVRVRGQAKGEEACLHGHVAEHLDDVLHLRHLVPEGLGVCRHEG